MIHRPSSIPLFLTCPSSAGTPKIKTDTDSEPADDGTAVHEALALMVQGQEPDLAVLAVKHDVDPTTLRVLYAYGCQAWREIGPSMSNPRTEVKVESDMFRGTADVLDVVYLDEEVQL